MRKGESAEKGRVKLRIVEFELDGNDASLQESLRTISSAINRATGVTVKRVNALPGVVPTPRNGDTEAAGVPEEPIESDIDETAEDVTQETASPRRSQRAARSYPQPKIIPDIDFNAASVSLKPFMDEKKPKSHNARFLAVTAWFTDHGQVPETTPDHVYTAYLAMDWRIRKNMVQPFYFLKDKGWVKQVNGGWTLTPMGRDRLKDFPSDE